jgi:DNA-directed RNA polymerase subunit RPC12/RpoP
MNSGSEFSTVVPRTRHLRNGEIMGYYQCIRCGGSDTYSSKESGRTMALTLDTPSAVDPTLFHTTKNTVIRCRACGEKCTYMHTPAEILRDTKFGIVIFWIALFVFPLLGLTFIVIPVTLLNWVGIFFLATTPLFLVFLMISKTRLKKLTLE